jgi:uncharacterized protein (TIGR00730 family)
MKNENQILKANKINLVKYFFYDLWLMVRIIKDFTFGFYTLKRARRYVTIYGSARFPEDHLYYKLSRTVGKVVAEEGFCVMTGGGPGVMEASARGAKDVGGRTFGCNIKLPMEQKPNPYLDATVNFRYFFARKLMLNKYAKAFVILPGGFGTLDEFAEIITLMQTGKIKKRPIIMMGQNYWNGFKQFMKETMVLENTIHKKDLDLITFTDDVEVVRQIVSNL